MTPGPLNLPTIWRGCDYPAVSFSWKDQSGNPFNLTGWTPHASSRNINFAPTVTNATGGVTQISLTKQQTATLKLGVEKWDWYWSNNGTNFPPVLSGSVPIKEPQTPTS